MWRKLKCSHQLYVSRSYADIMDMWHNLRDVNRYLKAAKLQSSQDNVESLMESSLKELSGLRHTEDLSLCLSGTTFMSFSPWREKVSNKTLHPVISDQEAKELRLRALLPGLLLDVQSSDRKGMSSRVDEMKKICTPSWRLVLDAFEIMLRLVSASKKEDLNKDKSLCERFKRLVVSLNKELERLSTNMSLWSSGPSSCLILSQSWTFMSRSLLVMSILVKTFSKNFSSAKKKKGKKKKKASKKAAKLSFQTVSDSLFALRSTCTNIATEFTKRIKKEVSNHKNDWNNDAMQHSEVKVMPIVTEHAQRGQKKCLLNLFKEIQSFSLYLKSIK